MSMLKNLMYNILYQILVILLPLVTVPYISGILGSTGIGDYAYTYANSQYFVLFGMIGISMYGSREIAYVRDNKENLKNTFFSIYILQLITTTISLILFMIFVGNFTEDYYYTLYLFQGLNIVAAIIDISWFFIGLEQFKKTVVRNTFVKLLSLASIFIFIKKPQDTAIYVLILSLSNLLGNLSLWLYIPKMISFKNLKVQSIFSHFKSSVSLFVPQIAIQVYVLLDRTLLGLMTNNSEVGYYENSQKLVKLVLTITTAIGAVLMPKIANTIASKDMNKVKNYIKNSFFFCSALSIPLMFGLMGIIREVYPWFFTEEFSGIDRLIIVSSLIILAITWSNVIGIQLMIPLKKMKEFTISVTMGAIVNFVLNLIMIKKFGALGACIATVFAEFTVTGIQLYFVRKMIPLKQLITPTFIFIPGALIMFFVVRMIGNVLEASIITNVIQALVGAIIYSFVTLISYRLAYKKSFITYVRNLIMT